ncbi:hypothetical protein JHL21_17290 [Devosia sp. WQ 349]|nr:hypothetical protein [Devosia sp. WQ 349K1]
MMVDPRKPEPADARVDYLLDENASRIELEPATPIKAADGIEASVGATGPTNWALYGLIALAVIIGILAVLQVFSGAPGTDMQPGSPTSAPVVETPATAPAAQ